MSRILVTGGAGFIGSHAVDALLAAGSDVRVFDDFSTGRRENLEGSAAGVEVVTGDVRDEDALFAAVRGCEAVLHLAAIASVAKSLADPATTEAVNVSGTMNVLKAAHQAGAARVVLASSCAVYGDAAESPLDEATPLHPLSPYAVSKADGERLCISWCDRGGLDTGALRFFNVFGPRQDPSSEYSGVIAAFAGRLAADQPCTIYGDGEQTRDFVYVSDVVRACLLALAARRLGGASLNVGTGIETSVKRLLEGLAAASGLTPRVAYAAARDGEIRRSCAERRRVADEIGWEPAVAIGDGLAATWRWHSDHAGAS